MSHSTQCITVKCSFNGNEKTGSQRIRVVSVTSLKTPRDVSTSREQNKVQSPLLTLGQVRSQYFFLLVGFADLTSLS